MKKIKINNLLLILFTLVGCNGNTSSSIKESSTVSETPFSNKIEANLVEGKDYTLAYTDNINEGAATIKISYKGNYFGSEKTITFVIVK